MHRFSRMHLSREAALRALDTIDLEEKSRLAESIALIAVIDRRRDFLVAGYSCMRDYCLGRLHMSEDQAFRRIQVARVALELPAVFECLADGRLSLATASVLAPHLSPETAGRLLESAAFKTRDEVLRLIAEQSRPTVAAAEPVEREANVETSSDSLAPGQVNSLEDLCAPPLAVVAPADSAPARLDSARRGRLSPSANGSYEVRLSITPQEHHDLSQATALLGHAVPSGDPALIYARAMKHYLAHLEKRRLGVKRPASAEPSPRTKSVSHAAGNANAPRGRGIPKALRRQVWERDGGRCAFVGTDGHRCEATRRLEFDHVVPIAQGGATTADNLRLLCRPHNQFEAERVLGKDHVAKRRELAQRERARAKAATQASKARAKARDAATQERKEDIHAALRGLGFTDVEARRGAKVANRMPEASLEVCIRQALTELTRAVASRGERRARCSA